MKESNDKLIFEARSMSGIHWSFMVVLLCALASASFPPPYTYFTAVGAMVAAAVSVWDCRHRLGKDVRMFRDHRRVWNMLCALCLTALAAPVFAIIKTIGT